jgi:hypothetical protein
VLPECPENRLRVWTGQDGQEGLRDFRWVEHLPLGAERPTVVLCGELPAGGEAVLYATNLSI